jgi:hypothetical protein
MNKIIIAGAFSTILMLLSFLDLLIKIAADTPYPFMNVLGLVLWPTCIALLWIAIYRHHKILKLRHQGSN